MILRRNCARRRDRHEGKKIPCQPSIGMAAVWIAVMSLLLQTVSSFQSIETMSQRRLAVVDFQSSMSDARLVTAQRRTCVSGPNLRRQTAATTTSLNMFMGSDGGLLGVGGPEIFTILLVGYFVLGPSDLYKLVKEIGKFIQNIRTLGSDLSTTFENNMESSLQLDELRKAQRELNDAFSFRRSINVDADSEAFSVQAGSSQENMNAAEMAASASSVGSSGVATTAATTATDGNVTATTTSAPPKKIRRRVRKRDDVLDEMPPPPPAVDFDTDRLNDTPLTRNIPDLEMPPTATSSSPLPTSSSSSNSNSETQYSSQELAEIATEFDKYVMGNEDFGWDKTSDTSDTSSSTRPHDDARSLSDGGGSTTTAGLKDAKAVVASSVEADRAAQNRFQQQLSGQWNDQILAADDKLEPMALVMNKIALLEQEKMAALRRLEDEFAKRTELEERFYRDQRQLLEETATEIQSVAFGVDPPRKS